MFLTNFTNLTTTPAAIIAVVVDNSCPLTTMAYTINSIIVPVISGAGIISNTWCIIVFALILYKESPRGHMFKYLMLKAVHDDIQFILQIFAPLYYCTTCTSTYETYASQVWYIWFYYYVECINELCSGFYEVAATFDCLLTINQKLDACKKNFFFYITAVLVFVFAALFYIFFLFNFSIDEQTRVIYSSYFNFKLNKTIVTNQTQEYWLYEYTEFAGTEANQILSRAHGMLRDVVTLILLFALNLLILLTMRRSVNLKKKVAKPTTTASSNGHRGSHRANASVRAAEEAQRMVTIMIIVIGVNYLFGHVTSFVKYIFLIDHPSPFRSCFTAISEFLFYLSYLTPFFIYFSFNKVFRSYAFGIKRASVAIDLSQSQTRTAAAQTVGQTNV